MENIKQKAREMFDEKFLYWVVLGSTLDNGSELRWNVGDDRMPDIDKIKSFIDQIIDLAIAERDKEIVEMILKRAKEDYAGATSILYLDDKAITEIINLINSKK